MIFSSSFFLVLRSKYNTVQYSTLYTTQHNTKDLIRESGI